MDPAGAGRKMLTCLGYIDGIHGTPYIAYMDPMGNEIYFSESMDYLDPNQTLYLPSDMHKVLGSKLLLPVDHVVIEATTGHVVKITIETRWFLVIHQEHDNYDLIPLELINQQYSFIRNATHICWLNMICVSRVSHIDWHYIIYMVSRHQSITISHQQKLYQPLRTVLRFALAMVEKTEAWSFGRFFWRCD